jgi:S-adenosylmethionine-diacylglycerol 3-amino-3-carboxypropyl transferase
MTSPAEGVMNKDVVNHVPTGLRAPVADRADFSGLRYALAWEDADVLVEGLAIRPGDRCLAIAASGDNALALLTADPAAVVAVDLSRAQLAALALRVAAFRTLDHGEVLDLLGVRAMDRPAREAAAYRQGLYARLRPALDPDARRFWDARPADVAAGVAHAGRFERYLALFRRRVLPLVHRRATLATLLAPKTPDARVAFYRRRWNTPAWRLLFRAFFSPAVMGRLGRDPAFFAHADARGLAATLLRRAEDAVTRLDPAQNPYLRFILTGTYESVLPLALRAEHFETIRARLGRLSWCHASLEAVAGGHARFDRFALSDVFEYVPASHHARLLEALSRVARPGARLACWNLLADRRRPEALAHLWAPREAEAARLHARDGCFFYRRFVLEDRV